MTDTNIILNKRLLCDLEMIGNGGFKPLKGFMCKNDYLSCLDDMRLASGNLFPIPIVLPIDENKKLELEKNNSKYVVLRDEQFYPVAKLLINDIYKPDIEKEAIAIFGTFDLNHPYIQIMNDYKNNYYLGGDVIEYYGVKHVDFKEYRMTTDEVRTKFDELGWKDNIIGFQTRNPMHRSHYELTKYAVNEVENSKLFLNPVVGITQPCDVEYHTRVRCYQKLLKYYQNEGINVVLSLLPLSMRMAGPREALWHAIIRKNYGCTHFIVGRDHAGPSYKKNNGDNFFGPYDAQELVEKHCHEIGIKVITAKLIVCATSPNGNMEYMQITNVPTDWSINQISGTQQRNMLETNQKIPDWFTFPEIADELYREYIPNHKKGLCLYFVGLSASGKSTIANLIIEKIKEEYPERTISYLDGDVVRTNLSAGLGFSREDRSKNVRRIGFVAKEVVRNRGICICANIAPYQSDREYNRNEINSVGNYVEIFVNTPVNICAERDPKGLYTLAFQGKIKQFTGVDDPFEEPKSDIVLDGVDNIDDNINIVMQYLKENNYLK